MLPLPPPISRRTLKVITDAGADAVVVEVGVKGVMLKGGKDASIFIEGIIGPCAKAHPLVTQGGNQGRDGCLNRLRRQETVVIGLDGDAPFVVDGVLGVIEQQEGLIQRLGIGRRNGSRSGGVV